MSQRSQAILRDHLEAEPEGPDPADHLELIEDPAASHAEVSLHGLDGSGFGDDDLFGDLYDCFDWEDWPPASWLSLGQVHS